MLDYFQGRFRAQLHQLTYARPNPVVLEHIMYDPGVIFFGGPDWDNCAADLSHIPQEDRPAFVTCLFILVVTDQHIYTSFHEHYADWRARTQFPKFGWSGFGPHNENPLKILDSPITQGVVPAEAIESCLPTGMAMFVNETKRFVEGQVGIATTEFFQTMMADRGFQQMNERPVVRRMKECLNDALRVQGMAPE